MANDALELISMADIARLAGQSRATVGNWKSRNPDFPAERGRGSRGPLYDRVEVTDWLESTNRLDTRPSEIAAVWRLADELRGDMTIDDAMSLILLLLAVMSKASPSAWQEVLHAPPYELDAILRSTVESLFPFATELVPHSKLPARSVARAMAALSTVERPRISLVADALLEQAATSLSHRGGEYLSPPSVRRLVVAIAEPVGTVYNPATGIGQLITDIASRTGLKDVRLFGQEINARVWEMSQLNLAIHEVKADVALGDIFREDHYPELRADCVVAVPPWNLKLHSTDRLMDDPRWVWGEPGPNDGNAAWIQHCLYHLADGGRAVIVLPNSALFEGGRGGRIRQRIVKAGLLDAVIALPPGLFASTNLACAVLVFSKGRTNVSGTQAPTLMVDLSESGDGQIGRGAALDDELIGGVAQTYRRWVSGEPPSGPNAAVAQFDDLAANDFVLAPSRYLSVPDSVGDFDIATRNRSDLLRRLDVLTEASRVADIHLKSILDGRR
jgi:type I restriction-modification system DNA methylase subunit